MLSSGDGNCRSYDYRHAGGGGADDLAYDEYAEADNSIGSELSRFKWRPNAVAAVAVSGKTVAVGDIRGNIMVGENDGTGNFDMKWEGGSYG